jgi:hypothetical protein
MMQHEPDADDNVRHCWLVSIHGSITNSFKATIKGKLRYIEEESSIHFCIRVILSVAKISQWSGLLLYWSKIRLSNSVYT